MLSQRCEQTRNDTTLLFQAITLLPDVLIERDYDLEIVFQGSRLVIHASGRKFWDLGPTPLCSSYRVLWRIPKRQASEAFQPSTIYEHGGTWKQFSRNLEKTSEQQDLMFSLCLCNVCRKGAIPGHIERPRILMRTYPHP